MRPVLEAADYVDYDPDTGILTWTKRFKWAKKHINIGDPITRKSRYGYVIMPFKDEELAAHRVAYAKMTGQEPPSHLDHINHNRSDNRWVNLRAANAEINRKNASLSKNNKSGTPGVRECHKSPGKYEAKIGPTHIGTFKSFEEAVLARKTAEIALGYHPNHGN